MPQSLSHGPATASESAPRSGPQFVLEVAVDVVDVVAVDVAAVDVVAVDAVDAVVVVAVVAVVVVVAKVGFPARVGRFPIQTEGPVQVQVRYVGYEHRLGPSYPQYLPHGPYPLHPVSSRAPWPRSLQLALVHASSVPQ